MRRFGGLKPPSRLGPWGGVGSTRLSYSASFTCLSCDFDIPCIRLFLLTPISPVAKHVRSYEKLETNLSIWLKLPDSIEDLVACICGLKISLRVCSIQTSQLSLGFLYGSGAYLIDTVD